MAGDAREARYGKVIWETSRADEGTISATGANIVARAVMAVADAEQAELHTVIRQLAGKVTEQDGHIVSLRAALDEKPYQSDLDDADAHAEAAEDALRSLRERIEALADDEPLIVSGIRRDMGRFPSGRGGELRHTPATEGYGASGCPGDNLAGWFDQFRALAAAPAVSSGEATELPNGSRLTYNGVVNDTDNRAGLDAPVSSAEGSEVPTSQTSGAGCSEAGTGEAVQTCPACRHPEHLGHCSQFPPRPAPVVAPSGDTEGQVPS